MNPRYVQHVKDAIRMTEQPVELKSMIDSGVISAATAMKQVKKDGAKAAIATIKEGIVVAKGKPITQKVIDNLAKNVVSDAAKRTATASAHIAAMLDSPAFDGPTKAHLKATQGLIDGVVHSVKVAPVPVKEIVGKWLAEMKDNEHSGIKDAAYLLYDALNGKPVPVTGSPGAEAYMHMVWLQDMAANSNKPQFRAAAHWFMAVLNINRSNGDIAPAPSVLSFEEALRMEMESGGSVLAETLCPEQADLIKRVRGRA